MHHCGRPDSFEPELRIRGKLGRARPDIHAWYSDGELSGNRVVERADTGECYVQHVASEGQERYGGGELGSVLIPRQICHVMSARLTDE